MSLQIPYLGPNLDRDLERLAIVPPNRLLEHVHPTKSYVNGLEMAEMVLIFSGIHFANHPFVFNTLGPRHPGHSGEVRSRISRRKDLQSASCTGKSRAIGLPLIKHCLSLTMLCPF